MSRPPTYCARLRCYSYDSDTSPKLVPIQGTIPGRDQRPAVLPPGTLDVAKISVLVDKAKNLERYECENAIGGLVC